MINVIELPMLHEYKYAWNVSSRLCLYVFNHLEQCQLLYKYKLSEILIFQKFGANDASKIKFEKIFGKNLFIFHLDIWQKSTEDFPKLLDYCLEKDIEVYIPMKQRTSPTHSGRNDNHIDKIRDILEGYKTVRYDLVNLQWDKLEDIEKMIVDSTKSIIRDLNLKKLIG